MAAVVEVLCPNGHRQKVKITPNTTILQVLEEVCTKKGFQPPEEYDLKHGRKILDVTLSIRFAGLPNHAKLELVKSQQTRAESEVKVALQLDGGERLLHTFPPATLLWDILSHWESQPNSSHKDRLTRGTERGASPVCAYMREEVVGEFALRETTLRGLGLTGGTAVIRLTHRQVNDVTLAEVQTKIEKEKARLAKMGAKVNPSPNLPQPSVSASARPAVTPTPSSSTRSIKTSESSSSKVSLMDTESPADIVSGTGTRGSTSQPILAPRKEEPMETDDTKVSRLSRQPVEEIVTCGAQAARDDAAGVARPTRRPTSGQPDLSAIENLPGVEVIRPDDFHDLSQNEQDQARAMAAEMFPHLFPRGPGQGGRPRQRPQPPPQPHQPAMPFANFKFPEETKGKNLYRNDLSEFNKEDYEPCERETMIYSLDEGTRGRPGQEEELPDDFFEVTVDDIRRMWTSMQTNLEPDGGPPLMTSVMRQQAKEAKMAKYPRVVVRVQFPDRMVLQGIFRPRETVHSLEKFVKNYLEEKTAPFYLYTTPPRCLLKDQSETLFEADLAPMAIVHFGSDTQKDHHLSTSVMSEITSQEAANRVVVKVMCKEKPQASTSGTAAAGSSGNASNRSKTSDAHRRPGPSGSSDETRKVPKWFKMGPK